PTVMASKGGWQRRFDDPIPLPRGRQLVTLKDAADYIMKLPKAEQNHERWHTAARGLLIAAERGGIMMLAQIAMLRSLNHGKPDPASTPRRKPRRLTGSSGEAHRPPSPRADQAQTTDDHRRQVG